MEMAAEGRSPKDWDPDFLKQVKEYGFSDVQLARLFNNREEEIRQIRKANGVETGLQTGGHLRCRVRGLHALLLLDVRTGK